FFSRFITHFIFKYLCTIFYTFSLFKFKNMQEFKIIYICHFLFSPRSYFSTFCFVDYYTLFFIFFSRQGLIFPLFVLSISTLDFSSELMLLLLHIINTETPYVNLFLCGNLNNNIGYFSVQGFLKVH